jgi:hypothetical protein
VRRCDAIDSWHALNVRNTRAARVSREAHPLYAEVIAEAAERGFVPAPLWMLEASGTEFADVLYLHRGEVFVKRAESIR